MRNLWLCYDRQFIVLDIDKFIIELNLSFTDQVNHELDLEKVALTYSLPYFPIASTIHDLCPIGFIKDQEDYLVDYYILITSDQGHFFMYHMDSCTSTTSENASPNLSQIIDTGNQMTSKLTSLIASFARTVVNTEYRSLSKIYRSLKEADGATMKPLLSWKDLGRNYLNILPGLNYTILTDSLGHYSLFDNFDGLCIRKIKEQITSIPLLVIEKSDLLAIFHPHENHLYYLLMPFGTEIRRMKLELTNQQTLLKILVDEQSQDMAIIFDLTSTEQPKLLSYRLTGEHIGI